MKKINFITSNKGKTKLLEYNFKEHNIDVCVVAQDLNIMEPQFDTVQEVSKFKAMQAFEQLKEPVLVEDGGLCISALNGFPGVYTKYVIKTLGSDGILKLLAGETNRTAKFISTATFIDENGQMFHFEQEAGEIAISEQKVDIESPYALSDLWKIFYLKEFGKNMCELTRDEVNTYFSGVGSTGSITKFAHWYIERNKS